MQDGSSSTTEIFVPRPELTPFFRLLESDREISHTFAVSPYGYTPHSTFGLFSLPDFSFLKSCFTNLDYFRPNIFGKKTKPKRGPVLGKDIS